MIGGDVGQSVPKLDPDPPPPEAETLIITNMCLACRPGGSDRRDTGQGVPRKYKNPRPVPPIPCGPEPHLTRETARVFFSQSLRMIRPGQAGVNKSTHVRRWAAAAAMLTEQGLPVLHLSTCNTNPSTHGYGEWNGNVKAMHYGKATHINHAYIPVCEQSPKWGKTLTFSPKIPVDSKMASESSAAHASHNQHNASTVIGRRRTEASLPIRPVPAHRRCPNRHRYSAPFAPALRTIEARCGPRGSSPLPCVSVK
ncbi:hypothetical protein Bbelb_207670 [Branchiostoma belcheri]|nr:hypothetical protein Bbelb_207670 [Branchiostoma belcheri]